MSYGFTYIRDVRNIILVHSYLLQQTHTMKL